MVLALNLLLAVLAVHVMRCIPDRRSSSSRTLKAVNFRGSRPCRPNICMLVLENPHCGVSGVPFMNNTTGADPTALSIAVRTSLESSLVCINDCEMRGRRVVEVADGCTAAIAPRRACKTC